ncbi:MAG: hypothetical protein JWP82_2132, partial [Humibacillus sp.]|nr:hypothetical protein [Humibacillus sp.]
IRNGYQKTNGTYFRNPRVAVLNVSDGNGHPYSLAACTPSGSPTGTCTIADDIGFQTFVFTQPVVVETIRFTIVSTFPGEPFPGKYLVNGSTDARYRPYTDASISDIQLIPVNNG